MTDILTVKDVSFSFGDKAVLNNVSLEVQKGEIVSILGPSGVGKSTLFNLIAGWNIRQYWEILFFPFN